MMFGYNDINNINSDINNDISNDINNDIYIIWIFNGYIGYDNDDI